MAGRLKDKVAVVTGAAPRGEGVGNGMATAILFAREGAKVVLVNRSAERAEALAKQIKDEGGEASVFAGDVAKLADVEAMADFAMKKYGRLDILHNNVGIGGPGTPGHILDPATGRAAARYASVSVVAADATTADALSTAFGFLAPEDISTALKTLPAVEAHLFLPDGRRLSLG